MKDDGRDELDDLIDGALPGYSSADPMEGLEERVLQRIQVAGAGRRGLWPHRLGFAVPALAALLLAGVVLRTWWKPAPQATDTTPSHAAPKLAAVKPPPPAPGLRKFPAPAPRGMKPRPGNITGQEESASFRALPKAERFPTPAPMTDEEHALAAWAGRAPVEAIQALADLRKRTDEPVAIQAIQIQPLQNGVQ